MLNPTQSTVLATKKKTDSLTARIRIGGLLRIPELQWRCSIHEGEIFFVCRLTEDPNFSKSLKHWPRLPLLKIAFFPQSFVFWRETQKPIYSCSKWGTENEWSNTLANSRSKEERLSAIQLCPAEWEGRGGRFLAVMNTLHDPVGQRGIFVTCK